MAKVHVTVSLSSEIHSRARQARLNVSECAEKGILAELRTITNQYEAERERNYHKFSMVFCEKCGANYSERLPECPGCGGKGERNAAE